MRRAPVLPTALTATLTVAVLGLAGCGDAEPAVQATADFDSVEVTGEPGTAPTVTWDGRMAVDELESKTLVEGDGAEVATGDQVLAQLWIGNGYTNEVALDTYAATPQVLTVGPDVVPAINEAVEGHTIGSRVVVAAPPESAFGETGNPQLGLGNQDTAVFVVDLVSSVLAKPEGQKRPLPAGLPSLMEDKDGVITGWDFAGADEPDGTLQTARLVTGRGPEVEKGDAIVARYLGQVFEGKKPFDENFSGDEPAVFEIGTGAVVKGWDRALVGTPVGSRVVIVVPPELGYGKEGNESAGIKGTDTLYFVVDVLATS